MSGVLWGLLSAITWATANFSIKPAAHRFGDISALVCAQLAGGLLVIPAAALIEGAPGQLPGHHLPLLPLGAMAALVAYVGLFRALRLGRLAVVAPIVSGWTVLSVLIGALWLSEDLTPSQWAGVALVILGNGLLANAQREGDDGDLRAAVGWALLSALGFGVMIPVVDQLGADIGALWAVPTLWGLELATGAALWLLLRALGLDLAAAFGPQSIPRDARGISLVGRVGVLEALGFVGLSVGISLAPIAIVAPVASLSTGLSVLLGLVLRRERLGAQALTGAILVSVGVVLTAI